MNNIIKTTSAVIVAGAIVAGALVWVGTLLARPTLDDLIERNNRLAEQDSVRAVQLENMTTAFQRISFDFQGEKELRERLQQRNAALLQEIDNQEDEILSLTEATTTLRDDLIDMETRVSHGDTSLVAHVDVRNEYDRGRIGVEGEVEVFHNADRARTDLSVFVQTSPLLVYTRDPDTGMGQVTLDFGDMPIVVDSIRGGTNLDDPIREIVRPTLPELAWKIGAGALGVGALVLVLVSL